MCSSVYLSVEASSQVFLWFFVEIDLSVPIEFTHNACLLMLFLLIVNIRVLLSLLIDCPLLFLRVISLNASA